MPDTSCIPDPVQPPPLPLILEVTVKTSKSFLGSFPLQGRILYFQIPNLKFKLTSERLQYNMKTSPRLSGYTLQTFFCVTLEETLEQKLM